MRGNRAFNDYFKASLFKTLLAFLHNQIPMENWKELTLDIQTNLARLAKIKGYEPADGKVESLLSVDVTTLTKNNSYTQTLSDVERDFTHAIFVSIDNGELTAYIQHFACYLYKLEINDIALSETYKIAYSINGLKEEILTDSHLIDSQILKYEKHLFDDNLYCGGGLMVVNKLMRHYSNQISGEKTLPNYTLEKLSCFCNLCSLNGYRALNRIQTGLKSFFTEKNYFVLLSWLNHFTELNRHKLSYNKLTEYLAAALILEYSLNKNADEVLSYLFESAPPKKVVRN